MLKTYYTLGEIARICGVHHATIFRASEHGLIKTSKTPGGHSRVSRADLEVFLKANNVPLSALGARMLRVLIIEDNECELRAYERALKPLKDLEVITADKAFDFGFLMKSFLPDLLLLDILLPDMDGKEVVRTLRGDEQTRKCRIAAITGIGDEAELGKVRACGVDFLLRKPVTADELRAKVRDWLLVQEPAQAGKEK